MTKIYLLEKQCVVLDPGPEFIPFLSTSAGFKVESVQPGPGFSPRFRDLTRENVLLHQPLFECNKEDLKAFYTGKRPNPDNVTPELKYSQA